MSLWGSNNISNSAPKWQTDQDTGETGNQEYGEDIIFVYGDEGYPVPPGWARRKQGTGNRKDRFMWESLATFKQTKTKSFALSKPVRVLVVGDSLTAGRGAGSGSVQMDGARALSWPTIMTNTLQSWGFNAQAESFCEGNNTGGSLPLYDPRITMGSFGIGAGRVMGGLGVTANTNTLPLIFTPTSNCDTFELYLPTNTTFGTGTYQINANGTPVAFSENGTAALQKIVITPTLGANDVRITAATSSNTVYVSPIVAYNAASKPFVIMNMGSRNFSTTDWIQADSPWRPFPSIVTYAPDITLISLGINDLRTSGANNSVNTFSTNMQSLITQAASGGGKVGLVVPPPCDLANEGSFTFNQLITVYKNLSSVNNIPLYRSDAVVGTWNLANTAGNTQTDGLHYKAPVYQTMGAGVAAMLRDITARNFAA